VLDKEGMVDKVDKVDKVDMAEDTAEDTVEDTVADNIHMENTTCSTKMDYILMIYYTLYRFTSFD
jgi:hypothetical protein